MQIQLPTMGRSKAKPDPGTIQATSAAIADAVGRVIDRGRSMAFDGSAPRPPKLSRETLTDLSNDISRSLTPAARAAGPALEALPQTLENLADALRSLPANLDRLPAAIEAFQRQRRPPFWRRQQPLLAILGLTVIGGLVIGWWMAMGSRLSSRLRFPSAAMRERAERIRGGSVASADVPTDQSLEPYAPSRPAPAHEGNGGPGRVTARTGYGTDARPDAMTQPPAGGAEALSAGKDQQADVRANQNPTMASPAGPHPELQPEVTERSIHG